MANYTQAQLDALRAAVATGHLRVTYADKTVVYRSLQEMKDLLSTMERDISSSSSTANPRVSQIRVRTSKGATC